MKTSKSKPVVIPLSSLSRQVRAYLSVRGCAARLWPQDLVSKANPEYAGWRLRVTANRVAAACDVRIILMLVSCERGSFTWAAFREYLVGGLGPGEGMAAVVPAVDEGLDGGDEVGDRGEAAAADGLPGD